MFKIYQVGG